MNPFAAIADRLSESGEANGGPYKCRGCGETYSVEYHVCPTCGGYSVESDYDPVVCDADSPVDGDTDRLETS
ncbi:hypothetical protein [Haloprofundus halophilus]|uniref:hypothetical protein n=1 Tax=Haloprofundus halophilus TaxID=2283527 RepID=UPI000E44F2A2|nr:hypothetical protein [Haloprofundus halophilus]